MFKRFIAGAIAVNFLWLTACAQHSGWHPAVDTYGDPNAANLKRDLHDCQILAEQASGNTGNEILTGAGVGAAIGAAAGVVGGAIAGNPGTGAAIGAATGGVGGATKQGLESDSHYKQAYKDCMRHRGHYVIE